MERRRESPSDKPRHSLTICPFPGLQLRSFQSKPNYAPSDHEKLVRLVARIEEKLWQASRSKVGP